MNKNASSSPTRADVENSKLREITSHIEVHTARLHLKHSSRAVKHKTRVTIVLAGCCLKGWNLVLQLVCFQHWWLSSVDLFHTIMFITNNSMTDRTGQEDGLHIVYAYYNNNNSFTAAPKCVECLLFPPLNSIHTVSILFTEPKRKFLP